MSFDAVTRGLGSLKDELNRSGNSSFGWLRIKGHGEFVIVRPLFSTEEDSSIVAVWEHHLKRTQAPYNVTCLGAEECPLCKQGKRPSLQAYFPFFSYDEYEKFQKGDPEARPILIWKRGKKGINDIIGLAQEYGNLKERDLKIQRHGTTKESTSYQLIGRDKAPFSYAEYVNEHLEGVIEGVVAMVAKKSPEEVITLATGGTLNSNQDSGVQPVPQQSNDSSGFSLPF